MESANTTARYVMVEGNKVYLRPEEAKEWDSFINRTRYEARKEGSCRQPDYHLCCGDCMTCRWHGEGLVLSLNDMNHDRDCLSQHARSGYKPISCERTPEDIVIEKESVAAALRRMSAFADEHFQDGARTLQMYLDGESLTEIARQTGNSVQVIQYRVRRLLELIRKNRKKFFD